MTTTRDPHRQAVAALWSPGWLELGAEPDIAARTAEMGAGYIECGAGGWCEEWDFQRTVPVLLVDGRVRVFRYGGRGHLQVAEYVSHEDHGRGCRCAVCGEVRR